MTRQAMTYKKAGVDVDAAQRFVRRIRPIVARSHRPEVLGSIGGFGGLFRFDARRYREPVLVSSSDGVGTKLELASLVGRYRGLGIDLVAMNVNDVLAAGAEPLFFVDYLAVGTLRDRVAAELVRGIVDGCRQAGCALVGGETAQMPGVYQNGTFDMAGFCVGAAERSKVLDGSRIRVGDRLIGVASSGPHANGYSLIRKALSVSAQRRLATQLLAPTRIYVKPVLEALRRCVVHGVAHITGGSFRVKLARILPPHVAAVLRQGSWRVPPVFDEIQRSGGVREEEMYRTFNMGIGMVLVVPPGEAEVVQRVMSRWRLRSWEIGRIERGAKEVILCR